MNPTAATLDLHDIHAAAVPSFWPPAPGWWLLVAVLLTVLVLLGLWAARRYRIRQRKRQIMDELESLSAGYSKDNISNFVASLSMLLRRVALQRHARARVASLTGTDWLRFLDDTGGAGEFAGGVGQILETGPYQRHNREVPAEALLALVRRWVSKNLEVTT